MVRVDNLFILTHIQSSGKLSQIEPRLILASKLCLHKDSKRQRKLAIVSSQSPAVTNLIRDDQDREIWEMERGETNGETNQDSNKSKEKKNGKKVLESLTPEDKEKLLKKTHLHLQRMNITHLDDMRYLKNVRVLFLQENHIKRIGHLRHMHNLQELYLHDNQIVRIEGLSQLRFIKKLLIPRNKIGVIEGLPPNLVELEAGGQFLTAGDSLLLDPQALTQVQATLKLLDISDNRLSEIGVVGLLHNLQILRASNNELKNLSHVGSVISGLTRIAEIDLRGNPVSIERLYRPEMICKSASTLRILDEKKVTEETREFFLNAERYRKMNRKQTGDFGKHKPTQFASQHFLFDERKGHQLPDECAVDLCNETSKYVLGSLKKSEFESLMNNRQVKTSGIKETEVIGSKDGTQNCQEFTRIIPRLFMRHKHQS